MKILEVKRAEEKLNDKIIKNNQLFKYILCVNFYENM